MKILIWETPEEEKKALINLGVPEQFIWRDLTVNWIPSFTELDLLGFRLPTDKEGEYIYSIMELLGDERSIWTRTRIPGLSTYCRGMASGKRNPTSSAKLVLICEG